MQLVSDCGVPACLVKKPIADQGVHTLHWAMSLNEDVPVARVLGQASGGTEMTGRQPSPDTRVAQIVFANGVRGLWHLGNTAPRVLDDPAYYKHCRVAAYADEGRTLYEEFGRWEIVSREGAQGGRIATQEEWLAGNHAAQAALTNAMFDWLEDEGKPAGTHLKRALEQWNVILGLYRSAVERRVIDLPFEPADDLWERLGETLR